MAVVTMIEGDPILDVAPDPSHGYPINLDETAKVAVEVLLPNQANPFITGESLVGGDDVVSSLEWCDVTGDLRSCTWTRGSAPGEPPEVGSFEAELANDGFKYSPWQTTDNAFRGAPVYFRAGTWIRVGAFDGDTWWPQITCIVTVWEDGGQGVDLPGDGEIGDPYVTIHAAESISWLAEVYGAGEELPECSLIPTFVLSPVVADDGTWRFWHLWDISLFPGGLLYEIDFDTSYLDLIRLPETTLDGSALADVQSFTDPLGLVFRSTRNGHAYLAKPEPDTTLYQETAFDLDSVITRNDREEVVNRITLSSPDGTQYVFTNGLSVGRNGLRAVSNTSMPHAGELNHELIFTEIAEHHLDRSAATYRIEGITYRASATGWEWVAARELGDMLRVDTKRVRFDYVQLWGMTHTITPQHGWCEWVADWTLAPSSLTEWSRL